jgi:hypothetical protein
MLQSSGWPSGGGDGTKNLRASAKETATMDGFLGTKCRLSSVCGRRIRLVEEQWSSRRVGGTAPAWVGQQIGRSQQGDVNHQPIIAVHVRAVVTGVVATVWKPWAPHREALLAWAAAPRHSPRCPAQEPGPKPRRGRSIIWTRSRPAATGGFYLSSIEARGLISWSISAASSASAISRQVASDVGLSQGQVEERKQLEHAKSEGLKVLIKSVCSVETSSL